MDKDETLKKIISEVNRTLGYFEADWVSAKRTNDTENERCSTFDQYIECRFNHECEFYFPEEFKKLVRQSEGHLFTCQLEKPDEKKCRFKLASLILIDSDLLLEPDETLKNELTNLKNWLGGNQINFTHKKKKFNFNISNKDE